MTEQPRLGVRVANLAASIAFYIDRIGFTLAEQQPEGTDVVCIIDSDGDPLLLAGSQVGEITAHLAKNHYILSAGETMGFQGGDLNARRATFLQRGIEDVK